MSSGGTVWADGKKWENTIVLSGAMASAAASLFNGIEVGPGKLKIIVGNYGSELQLVNSSRQLWSGTCS